MVVELHEILGTRSAAALAEAFDQFPDGVAVFEPVRDEAGVIVDFLCRYANPATAALSRVPIDGLIGHRLLEVAPGFRDTGPFRGYCQAVEQGVPWDLEVDFDGAMPGGHVTARMEMRAVRLATGVLVTYRDVTTLRRGEDALERMAAIVRCTEDAIVSADLDGRITHFNPGAERLLGYAAGEILGRYVRLLVRPEDFPMQEARFRQVIGGDAVARITTQWVRRDHSLIDVLLSAAPLRDRSGAVVGVTAVVHDITDRRRIESELRRSNAELERFAAVAAHDLRTPLITLSMLARLLARDDLERERRDEIAGHLEAAADHACRLVDGLTEYAQTARSAPVRGPVDLEVVATGLLVTLGPALTEARAHVEVCALPTVHGDGGGLTRVLQNLLVNAIKYRGEADPRIVLEAHRGDGEWIVAVRDNGVGVREHDRSRIFEIFTRARPEGDPVTGEGLGLAVCQTIVEHHGGRIWVEPEPGGGSAFRFSVPERRVSRAARSTAT
jgi:PAS domain S-box-containing protein